MSTPTLSPPPRSTPGRTGAGSGAAFGAERAVLRLHRTALWIWTGLFAACAGLLVRVYLLGQDVMALDACEGGGWRPSCLGATADSSIPQVVHTYEQWSEVAALVLTALPFIFAAWVGAAVIARELESGTVALAWTQSVTPVRWLVAKLTVPAALITAGMAVLTGLFALSQDSGGLGHHHYIGNVFYFAAAGPVGVALALLGLTVGALCGLVLRRTLLTVPVSLVAMAAVSSLVNQPRFRLALWPAETTTSREWGAALPDQATVVAESGLDASGQPVPGFPCHVTGQSTQQCGADLGVVRYVTEFHPTSHFWPLQLVQTGIVLALTAACVALAVTVLRRRTP